MDIEALVEEVIGIYMEIWGIEYRSQVKVIYFHYEGWAIGHEEYTTLSWHGWEKYYNNHMTLEQLKNLLLEFKQRTKK